MTFFEKLIFAVIAITLAIPLWTAAVEKNSNHHTKINSNITLSSTKLIDTPFIFQSGYNHATWSGHLRKIGIHQRADGSVTVSPAIQWDAGELLAAQPVNDRKIFTYIPVIKQDVAFEWEQLPAEIQALFNRSPDTNRNDDLGAQRVNYLRGDRRAEARHVAPSNSRFRTRDNVLGDIIHSAPVHVGAPTKNMIGADYSSFYEQHNKRPATVFVGANDGMLHAFSADSGKELFAYIPNPLLKKLPKLTTPSYQHEPMMDGNLHVGEAHVLGQWKTVLAAGMGFGAKGVFALDVTAPDQFMAGKRTLFEFTDKDDADMGYITSPPAIAKISVGTNKNGSKNYKYFVVVSSGDPSATVGDNGNGETFLFLLSLDKDPAIPWFRNSNYYKLSPNSNNAATINVLSAPALVSDAQGATIYAYAGDLQGNVWRFDFTSNNLASVSPKIIFTAKDNDNHPQPITAQPTVSFSPDGGYLVLFGTGNNTDINIKQNSFYAIRDTTKNIKEDYFISGRSHLAERKLVPATANGKTGYRVTGSDFTFGPSSSDKKGWYIDYQQKHRSELSDESANKNCGERSISNGTLAFGSVFFNTVIPSGGLCDEEGASISYAVNALTGKLDTPDRLTGLRSQAGMLGTPVVVIAQTSLADRDFIGRRYNTQHYSILNLGTKGIDSSSEIIDSGQVTLKAGRLSWREISNWHDLKN